MFGSNSTSLPLHGIQPFTCRVVGDNKLSDHFLTNNHTPHSPSSFSENIGSHICLTLNLSPSCATSQLSNISVIRMCLKVSKRTGDTRLLSLIVDCECKAERLITEKYKIMFKVADRTPSPGIQLDNSLWHHWMSRQGLRTPEWGIAIATNWLL